MAQTFLKRLQWQNPGKTVVVGPVNPMEWFMFTEQVVRAGLLLEAIRCGCTDCASINVNREFKRLRKTYGLKSDLWKKLFQAARDKDLETADALLLTIAKAHYKMLSNSNALNDEDFKKSLANVIAAKLKGDEDAEYEGVTGNGSVVRVHFVDKAELKQRAVEPNDTRH